MCKRYLLACFVFLISNSVDCQNVIKGFQNFSQGNVALARGFFKKDAKSSDIGAYLGLAKLYSSSDYVAFQHPDSAIYFYLQAKTIFSALKPKKQSKLELKYKPALVINQQEFDILRDGLVRFSKEYVLRTDSLKLCNDVTELLNAAVVSEDVLKSVYVLLTYEVAFHKASKRNTYLAYKSFGSTYPDATQKPVADSLYELRYFESFIKDNDPKIYQRYIDSVANRPGSYSRAAEDSIFTIFDRKKNISAYYSFIDRYPQNRNVAKSWKQIYDLFIDGKPTTEKLKKFQDQYPDYPDFARLKIEMSRLSISLLKYAENNKFGFIDYEGKTVIQPAFEDAEDFTSINLAPCKQGELWGYIDKTGAFFIKPDFEEAEPFHNEIAIVSQKGRTGVIDRFGNFLINPIFTGTTGEFTEGYHVVNSGEDSLGLINEAGQLTLAPGPYQLMQPFRAGWVSYKNNTTGFYGAFNLKNRTKSIEARYDSLSAFSRQGTAVFKKNGKFGLLDTLGKEIVEAQHAYIHPEFSEERGVTRYYTDAGKYGLINSNGAIIKQPDLDDKQGLLRKEPFIEGYSKLISGKDIGLIRDDGSVFLLPSAMKCEDIKSMKNGIIPFKQKTGWGLVRKNGDKFEDFVKPVYEDIDITAGKRVYLVRSNGLYGFMDMNGKEIVTPVYKGKPFPDNTRLRFRVTKNGKSGFCGGDSLALILECEYSKIELVSPNLIYAEKLVELNGNRVIRFGYYSLENLSWIWKEVDF